jgi:hypothetical protein
VGKGTIGLAAMMVVLLVVSGCGGGGDTTVSQSDYKNQVKLVCNESEQRIETLVQRLKHEYQESEQVATAQFQAENLLKVIDAYEVATGELADIGFPEEEEKKAEEMIRVREEAAAKVQASPLGTRDALPVIFKEANVMAEDLGAGGCIL